MNHADELVGANNHSPSLAGHAKTRDWWFRTAMPALLIGPALKAALALKARPSSYVNHVHKSASSEGAAQDIS